MKDKGSRHFVKEKSNKSLKKVVFFSLVVVLLILLSLFYKLFFLLQQSKFNDNSLFILSIYTNDNQLEVLSINPVEKKITNIILTHNKSTNNSGILLGVPVNGDIHLLNNLNLSFENPSSDFLSLILHKNSIKSNLTTIDLIRLYLLSLSVDSKKMTIKRATLPMNDNEITKLLGDSFYDTKIKEEDISIEIINGTDINGKGKQLERMIINFGGNVISVVNSAGVEKDSKIVYYKNQSYTVLKLQQILNYPIELTDKRGIADIKIIVGRD